MGISGLEFYLEDCGASPDQAWGVDGLTRDVDELCQEEVSSVCKPAILRQDIYPNWVFIL
ncbi:hypothetical protein OIU77_001894 [Salix suchowensis]|uniref:Uncharacterized protein n=1 Tax=Salix suchowensis TaxID=1278906 RepID=A0ABQ9B571_9ROSI|nr:hypothetical protein OIU77_001894 [Salix suchowensis]